MTISREQIEKIWAKHSYAHGMIEREFLVAVDEILALAERESNHDFAHIITLCCDADEADPRTLLHEIATIASKASVAPRCCHTHAEKEEG